MYFSLLPGLFILPRLLNAEKHPSLDSKIVNCCRIEGSIRILSIELDITSSTEFHAEQTYHNSDNTTIEISDHFSQHIHSIDLSSASIIG
ncbi:hypothetical protein AYI70_g1570 [Smittium culicis]|uniref:Uncharacterized protein n=1 Tax=Smittium culicis TaxID=133412 RepID=A0A1R1YCQ6_9FUNG|nr:hypothetical protein AYI70_g1570 [Smittium culicis]